MELAAEPVAVPLFTPFPRATQIALYYYSKVWKKGVRKTKTVNISKLAPSISFYWKMCQVKEVIKKYKRMIFLLSCRRIFSSNYVKLNHPKNI